MIPLTLEEIARITAGRVGPSQGPGSRRTEPGKVVVDGPVVTDSRQAQAGSLYVARIGEHADGHLYAGGAAAQGAVAALVTREVTEVPYVLVDDVQEAFAALAEHVVRSVPGLQVIGLTGSSGKTSTKDLLEAVLSEHGPTVATQGSLNSEVGVPITVCRTMPDTRYLVLEMGTRGPGQIRYLTEMTHPSVGVELNVGTAHVGEFGSRERIADAKGELVESLPADGLAVLNADDPLVAAMAGRTRARVVRTGRDAPGRDTPGRETAGRETAGRETAGPGKAPEIRAGDVRVDAQGRASFTLHTPEGSAPVALRLLGEHMVDNALAAAAVAREMGMGVADVAAALSRAERASRWRLERHDRPDGVTVLNDAYNANPDSLAAALRTLAAMGRGRRTWAVVGEMLELGGGAEAAHREAGQQAAGLGVDELVAVGEMAGEAARGFGARGRTVGDLDAAYDLLAAELAPGDIVLLKSSHGSGLRHLGDRLVDPAARSQGGTS